MSIRRRGVSRVVGESQEDVQLIAISCFRLRDVAGGSANDSVCSLQRHRQVLTSTLIHEIIQNEPKVQQVAKDDSLTFHGVSVESWKEV